MPHLCDTLSENRTTAANAFASPMISAVLTLHSPFFFPSFFKDKSKPRNCSLKLSPREQVQEAATTVPSVPIGSNKHFRCFLLRYSSTESGNGNPEEGAKLLVHSAQSRFEDRCLKAGALTSLACEAVSCLRTLKSFTDSCARI